MKAAGENFAAGVEAEWAGDSPLPTGVATKRPALLRNGRATIDGVPPGRWRVRLDGTGNDAGITRLVTVKAGATADAEF